MKKVITSVVDGGDYMEVHATYAQQITCGLPHRRSHHWFGVEPAANPGRCLGYCVEREGRCFVRTCDAFNIPIVTFVDVPGFMPGVDQEYGGIIATGRSCSTPSAKPPCRHLGHHAQGLRGAYVVMNSKSIGADFAYPGQRPTSRDGLRGRVEIVHRRDLSESDDPRALRASLIEDYEERYATPYIAAERGFIDDVIDPAETRRILCSP